MKHIVVVFTDILQEIRIPTLQPMTYIKPISYNIELTHIVTYLANN